MNYFAQQEELEIEFNSRFDAVSEAFGELARDCNAMAEDDAAWYAEMDAAFIGPRQPVSSVEIPF